MRFSQYLKTFRVVGSDLMAELMGGLITPAPIYAPASFAPLVTITYSAAPVPNLALGALFVMTATNATAIVLGAPINPPVTGYSAILVFTLANGNGGAMGALTFNAIYKTAGVFTVPATTKNRSIAFRWDGTSWVELWRGAADVAN